MFSFQFGLLLQLLLLFFVVLSSLENTLGLSFDKYKKSSSGFKNILAAQMQLKIQLISNTCRLNVGQFLNDV